MRRLFAVLAAVAHACAPSSGSRLNAPPVPEPLFTDGRWSWSQVDPPREGEWLRGLVAVPGDGVWSYGRFVRRLKDGAFVDVTPPSVANRVQTPFVIDLEARSGSDVLAAGSGLWRFNGKDWINHTTMLPVEDGPYSRRAFRAASGPTLTWVSASGSVTNRNNSGGSRSAWLRGDTFEDTEYGAQSIDLGLIAFSDDAIYVPFSGFLGHAEQPSPGPDVIVPLRRTVLKSGGKIFAATTDQKVNVSFAACSVERLCEVSARTKVPWDGEPHRLHTEVRAIGGEPDRVLIVVRVAPELDEDRAYHLLVQASGSDAVLTGDRFEQAEIVGLAVYDGRVYVATRQGSIYAGVPR